MLIEKLFNCEEYLRKEKEKKAIIITIQMTIIQCTSIIKCVKKGDFFVFEEQSTYLAFITPSGLQQCWSKMFI